MIGSVRILSGMAMSAKATTGTQIRLRIATTTPMAFRAQPVEPAEREFALLLARQPAGAGQKTAPVLLAGSGSRHRPSDGAAS